jgi:hypothetical protein
MVSRVIRSYGEFFYERLPFCLKRTNIYMYIRILLVCMLLEVLRAKRRLCMKWDRYGILRIGNILCILFGIERRFILRIIPLWKSGDYVYHVFRY